MRKFVILTALVAVAVLLLPACQKKQDPEADAEAVKTLVLGDATWFGNNTKSDSGESTLFVLNDTTVLNWWRGGPTTYDQPVITVGVSGDSAYVEWKRHHRGWFYQWYDPGNGQPRGSWSKRLGDTTRINAVFLRRGKVSDTNRGWRLNRVSILTGESDSTRAVAIDSLRIQSTSVGDRVFSGPLGTFWDTTNLVRFTPGEQVTLTLYTRGPVGEAYLHSIFWRWPFADQGNGVFTGTWNAPWIPAIRLVVFDLLNKNTIRTQAEPYDFHGWLFPYQVKTAD